MKKIAILTSGGDCPGMNCCIHSLYHNLVKNKYEPYYVKNGFQGLVDNEIYKLEADLVKDIENLGGTIIKSSRSLDFQTKEGMKKAVDNLHNNCVDFLIILGGNGSYRGARDLMKEGISVATIPSTIDNDLFYTEFTLGFASALGSAISCIGIIKTSMNSMGNTFIIETMGRDCADLTNYAGNSTNADIIITNESFVSIDDIMNKCVERNNPTYILLQEKLINEEELINALQKVLKEDVKFSRLGYLQRGVRPCALDKLFAKQYAEKVITELAHNKNFAVGIKNNEFFAIPIEDSFTINNHKKLY